MDSQNKRILEHLLSGKSITALEALNLYGCFRLSGRIYDLRKIGKDMGFEIITEKKKVTDKYGTEKFIAKYYLKEVKRDS